MALRRGVVVILVLILVAVAISAAGLLFIGLAVGRPPTISSNSTLLLDVGGDLQEMEPSGVLGQFMEAPPTVRSLVESLRKASVDRRVSSVIIRPTSNAALWGKVQEVRDAIIAFKASKKPIVAFLEYGGDQSYYLASACDKVFLMPTASLDLTGHGELRALPARRSRQDRRVSRLAPCRRLQDGVEHVYRACVYARSPRNGRIAQQRSLRAADRGSRRGSSPDAGRDARARRPWSLPARGRSPCRARRRPRLRGRARRQSGARARPRHDDSPARVPAASAPVRSG